MNDGTRNCPPWCERRHGAGTAYAPHSRYVAEETLLDGAQINVIVCWNERVDDLPSDDPHITVTTHTVEESATVELMPGQAGLLAEVLAAARGGHLAGAWPAALAGDACWLPGALAEAATLLGYQRDEVEL